MRAIKRSTFLRFLALGALGGGSDAVAAKTAPKSPEKAPKKEQDPPSEATPAAGALEPLCVAIEPAALRTETARPFAEGKRTVIAPAREEADGLDILSADEFKALGLTWDEYLRKAEAGATRLLVAIKPEWTKDEKGNTTRAVLRSVRHMTPGIVLSPRFLPLFSPIFGDRIVVLMPDRFTVHLFSRNFSDFQTFGPKILETNATAVWPCSIEAFEVSKTGIKCLGAFDDGE